MGCHAQHIRRTINPEFPRTIPGIPPGAFVSLAAVAEPVRYRKGTTVIDAEGNIPGLLRWNVNGFSNFSFAASHCAGSFALGGFKRGVEMGGLEDMPREGSREFFQRQIGDPPIIKSRRVFNFHLGLPPAAHHTEQLIDPIPPSVDAASGITTSAARSPAPLSCYRTMRVPLASTIPGGIGGINGAGRVARRRTRSPGLVGTVGRAAFRRATMKLGRTPTTEARSGQDRCGLR